MNNQRLTTGFFLMSIIFCTDFLLARDPIQNIIKAEDQQKCSLVKSIPEVPHSIGYKNPPPKKLSWSEWLASFGPAFQDYWTKNPERWQFPATMFATGAIFTFLADPDEQIKAIKDLSGPAVLSMLVTQYLRYFLVTAAHEGGHAAVNYFVSGAVSDIYLGSEAADGVEILPHVILAGINPSRGQSTNIINPMVSDGVLQKNLREVFETFQLQYPTMSMTELSVLPAFQHALTVARAKSKTKTVQGRLQYFAVIIAGVVAGLVTNGLVKLGMGNSVLSIDHVDMTQLFNLFPAAGFDGGVITSEIFDLPMITDAAQDCALPATIVLAFLKAATELYANNPNKNAAKIALHAFGLALMNVQGIVHFKGN